MTAMTVATMGDLPARLDYGGVWLRRDIAQRYRHAMDVALRQAEVRAGGGDVPSDVVVSQRVLALVDAPVVVSAPGQHVAVTLPPVARSTHDLFDSGEAAARLGVTPRTVRRWAARGTFRCVRVGDRLAFRADDIEAVRTA